MRGFPIVSIGTMTSNATFADGVVNNSFIVAPQFELDEYFSGSKSNLDNYYRNKQYANFSANIESITVNPNNLDSITGEMSKTIASQGFRYFNSYNIAEKSVNVQFTRIDCFYLTKVDLGFMALGAPTKKTQIVKHTYVNLPNTLYIKVNFNLLLSTNMYNIYLNIPKCISIGNYLFHQHRIVNNLYFNVSDSLTFGIDCCGFFTDYTMTVNSTLNNVSSLVQKLRNSMNNTGNYPSLVKFKVSSLVQKLRNSMNNTGNYPSLVKFKEGKVVTDIVKTFDLRYWSKYENETGLDVGLLEGSNLR